MISILKMSSSELIGYNINHPVRQDISDEDVAAITKVITSDATKRHLRIYGVQSTVSIYENGHKLSTIHRYRNDWYLLTKYVRSEYYTTPVYYMCNGLQNIIYCIRNIL